MKDMLKGLSPEAKERIIAEWHRQSLISNGGCGSTFMYMVMLFVVLILTGCKTQKIIEQEQTRDSIATEIKIVKEIIRDTAYIEIPAQTAERTTADSVSHLENDYALSDARINADGTLFHSLETKPQKKPVEVEKKIERKDSIVYRDRDHVVTVTETVAVEKELSWWQKTQMYGFWAALAVAAFAYRKKLFSLIIRLFVKI